MSASRWRSAWLEPIVRPNWRRSAAYGAGVLEDAPGGADRLRAREQPTHHAEPSHASSPRSTASPTSTPSSSTAAIGTVGSNGGCGVDLRAGHQHHAGLAVDQRDDREPVHRAAVLDRHLPARAARRRTNSACTASTDQPPPGSSSAIATLSPASRSDGAA